MSRRLKIAVSRAADQHGSIPLTAFVRSLGALQRATCQIAEMLSESSQRRTSGSFGHAVRDACAFNIVSLSYGSGVAELELPAREQTIFAEMDLGVQATGKLLELSRLLTTEQSWEQVAELLPVQGYRSNILETYQDICPTAEEQIVVSLQDPVPQKPIFRLTSRERALARVYAVKTAVEDIVERRSFVGRVTRLDKDPEFNFGLQQGTRQYRFPCGLARREELIDLWKRDCWVRVDAVARVIKHDDRDDVIVELLDVDEVIEVDMSPLSIYEIVVNQQEIALTEPLTVPARAEGGLVLYEEPTLRIVASGPTPEDAEAEFREELAWLWTSYGETGDNHLSADARALKARLHAIFQGGE